MTSMTDEALLIRIRDDDRLAFRTLTQRYVDKICRLAHNITGNRQDAEDITQEVFITVWNKRLEWKDEGAQFSTWLYRVTFNRAIDFKRRRRETSELHDDIEETGKKADDIVADEELRRIFLACLKTMPENQMKCLIWYYYEEIDVKAICVKLGASEDSVRSLLKRAKVSLRAALSAKLGDEFWLLPGMSPYTQR